MEIDDKADAATIEKAFADAVEYELHRIFTKMMFAELDELGVPKEALRIQLKKDHPEWLDLTKAEIQ